MCCAVTGPRKLFRISWGRVVFFCLFFLFDLTFETQNSFVVLINCKLVTSSVFQPLVWISSYRTVRMAGKRLLCEFFKRQKCEVAPFGNS